MIDPIDVLIEKREEIVQQYIRVAKVSYGEGTVNIRCEEFRSDRKNELVKLKNLIDKYRVIINIAEEIRDIL